MAKITSADCADAIKASPLFAGWNFRGSPKRRSKQNIDGKIVRIFEVFVVGAPRRGGFGTAILYVRVVEDFGRIVEVSLCDLVAAERQNLRSRVESYLKPSAAAPAPIEEQDDIDAERFKQMVKKTEEPEDDIDAERFKRIERR